MGCIINQKMQEKKYKIECYCSALMGHAIPLAKVAELLQSKFLNSNITYVTYEIGKQRLEKEFKNVHFVGTHKDITPQIQKKLLDSPPPILFAHLFSEFESHLAQMKEKPDLIITDIFAVAPQRYAKQNGIPLIVNFPNSYGTVQNLFNFLSLNRSHTIEGFLISYNLPKIDFLQPFDEVMSAIRGHGRIIFQSFTGLDEPNIMPPNHTLVGLLPNRSTSELTPDLSAWIQSWKEKGKDKFLYVSFGSILKLSQNFAKKLANIFVRLGYPTIWSLSVPEPSEISDPLIFHKPWLPQQAILRIPEVRGYMTHCGWGSITEAIATKTPLICVPVFADQPENARLVVKRHIGIQIYETDNFRIPEFYEIDISDEKIESGVTEILEDETYHQSIDRLSRLNKLHNSTDNICKIVLESLEFGNSHLINPVYETATTKTGTPLSKIIVKEYLPPNAA